MAFRIRRLAIVASIPCLFAATAAAQPPAPTPTTAVLVTLTVKPDVDRPQVASTLPEEVRATVRLYLDGMIQQWFSRQMAAASSSSSTRQTPLRRER